MTLNETLQQLKSLSNEKIIAFNNKKGATVNTQFGVKMGNIRNLANKIKADHELGDPSRK